MDISQYRYCYILNNYQYMIFESSDRQQKVKIYLESVDKSRLETLFHNLRMPEFVLEEDLNMVHPLARDFIYIKEFSWFDDSNIKKDIIASFINDYDFIQSKFLKYCEKQQSIKDEGYTNLMDYLNLSFKLITDEIVRERQSLKNHLMVLYPEYLILLKYSGYSIYAFIRGDDVSFDLLEKKELSKPVISEIITKNIINDTIAEKEKFYEQQLSEKMKIKIKTTYERIYSTTNILLSWLIFIKDANGEPIKSIKHLSHEHIPLLVYIKSEMIKAIKKLYPYIFKENLFFFHEYPTYRYYNKFHIVVRYLHPLYIEQIQLFIYDRNILLKDIINNLHLNTDYYKNKIYSFHVPIRYYTKEWIQFYINACEQHMTKIDKKKFEDVIFEQYYDEFKKKYSNIIKKQFEIILTGGYCESFLKKEEYIELDKDSYSLYNFKPHDLPTLNWKHFHLYVIKNINEYIEKEQKKIDDKIKFIDVDYSKTINRILTEKINIDITDHRLFLLSVFILLHNKPLSYSNKKRIDNILLFIILTEINILFLKKEYDRSIQFSGYFNTKLFIVKLIPSSLIKDSDILKPLDYNLYQLLKRSQKELLYKTGPAYYKFSFNYYWKYILYNIEIRESYKDINQPIIMQQDKAITQNVKDLYYKYLGFYRKYILNIINGFDKISLHISLIKWTNQNIKHLNKLFYYDGQFLIIPEFGWIYFSNYIIKDIDQHLEEFETNIDKLNQPNLIAWWISDYINKNETGQSYLRKDKYGLDIFPIFDNVFAQSTTYLKKKKIMYNYQKCLKKWPKLFRHLDVNNLFEQSDQISFSDVPIENNYIFNMKFLKGSHISMLKDVYKNILKMLSLWGLNESNVKILSHNINIEKHLHYHVAVISLFSDPINTQFSGTTISRSPYREYFQRIYKSYSLVDIIYNLELDPDYYSHYDMENASAINLAFFN